MADPRVPDGVSIDDAFTRTTHLAIGAHPDDLEVMDYHGVAVQGTWVKTFGEDDTRTLPPGSYVLQPGEKWHRDGCAGPDDCIIFVHSSEARDATLKRAH